MNITTLFALLNIGDTFIDCDFSKVVMRKVTDSTAVFNDDSVQHLVSQACRVQLINSLTN